MTLDQLPNALGDMRRSDTVQAVSRRHLRCLVVVVVLVGVWASFGAAARDRQKNESPLGLWQTPGGGVIEISLCGRVLCGRIVGIPRAPGESIPKDSAGRSQCGLTIIRQAAEGQDGSWSGRITDPRDGTQYQMKLWLDDRGSLHVRGYIGVPLLGQTQIWRRYTGRLGPECTIAS
jgi:uncharacterized protein (DUF2147 family)